MAERYRQSATKYWSETLSDIAKVKIGYQKEIRALKKAIVADLN